MNHLPELADVAVIRGMSESQITETHTKKHTFFPLVLLDEAVGRLFIGGLRRVR